MEWYVLIKQILDLGLLIVNVLFLKTSWTALLVAAAGNHVDVVKLLLEHKPNVNALDKDGCSALTIACKEGYHDIAVALINYGAYINTSVSYSNFVMSLKYFNMGKY